MRTVAENSPGATVATAADAVGARVDGVLGLLAASAAAAAAAAAARAGPGMGAAGWSAPGRVLGRSALACMGCERGARGRRGQKVRPCAAAGGRRACSAAPGVGAPQTPPRSSSVRARESSCLTDARTGPLNLSLGPQAGLGADRANRTPWLQLLGSQTSALLSSRSLSASHKAAWHKGFAAALWGIEIDFGWQAPSLKFRNVHDRLPVQPASVPTRRHTPQRRCWRLRGAHIRRRISCSGSGESGRPQQQVRKCRGSSQRRAACMRLHCLSLALPPRLPAPPRAQRQCAGRPRRQRARARARRTWASGGRLG
jgi:hypothetical protein